MDYYCYFQERFTWGSNPYTAVAGCQQIVVELLDNPRIPFRIAATAAVDLLAALADYAGNGCMVSKAYSDVLLALTEALYTQQTVVEAIDQEWNREGQAVEIHPDDVQYDDPDDYEAWPVDLDGEEPDDEPEPDGAKPSSTLDAIQEALCAGCEAGAGVRRPFPDWNHISSWTQTDWIKMKTFKSKMLAAGHDFFTMGPAIDALAAAKEAMPHIPLPRQVELSMLAVEIVDGLIDGLETNLQALCAGSLHTHRGRRIQQEMCCLNKNGLNQVP